MTSMAIVALLALCGWLIIKLSGANKDIADLRARVESLKRQMLRKSICRIFKARSPTGRRRTSACCGGPFLKTGCGFTTSGP
jgi:hypothetical protein